MFKTSTLAKTFAIAAVALGSASAAYADEAHSFVHAGTTYTYTERASDNGRRVIAGTASDGREFRLVVGSRLVRGTFNGNPVTFSLSDVARTKVAMR